MQEEINGRLNSGNACYHSIQKLLSSRLLSKNKNIIMYKTIILPVVLCGCETWSLTLRKEHGLRVSENWVLKRIFGLKRDDTKMVFRETGWSGIYWIDLTQDRDQCRALVNTVKYLQVP
jgi:hypothetical protein